MNFQPPLRPSHGHNQGRGARSTASASAATATAPAAPTVSVISRATSAAATYETMNTDQIADNMAVFLDSPDLRHEIKNDPKLADAFDRVVTVIMAKNGAPTNVGSGAAPASLAPTSSASKRARSSHVHQRQQQHAEEEEEEGEAGMMGTGHDQQLFDLRNPPAPQAEPWPEQEAQACLHKAIDNILYYEVLAARYAAARRHSKASARDEGGVGAASSGAGGGQGGRAGAGAGAGDGGASFVWTDELADEEAWAVQTAAYWAKVRLRLEMANRGNVGGGA